MIILKSPQNGALIDLHTDMQKNFFSIDRSDVVPEEYDYLNLKPGKKEEYSFPKKLRLEWECEGEVRIELAENDKFQKSYSYSANNFLELENLKCNTRYFWRVISNGEISDTFFFDTTDSLPRFIRLEGTTNVRDCGGWKTIYGKRIKQGMLYRGTEINSHFYLTYNGMKVMKEFLSIKSVLDLRGVDRELVANAYGGNYTNIHAIPYCMWLNDQPHEVTKKLFDFIFDKSNYPIYFHCHGGADRTGTLSFFIGALLGMSYDNLLDDYEATSLSVIGIRSRNSKQYAEPFLAEFLAMEGETPAEKAENYLISCGVSKESIQNFRDFMIE